MLNEKLICRIKDEVKNPLEQFLLEYIGITVVLPGEEKTIAGIYYSSLLDKVRKAIMKISRGMVSKGVLFLQDNAPVHKSQVHFQIYIESVAVSLSPRNSVNHKLNRIKKTLNM